MFDKFDAVDTWAIVVFLSALFVCSAVFVISFLTKKKKTG